jgi:transcriptional regulator with XRE-family HTH domain
MELTHKIRRSEISGAVANHFEESTPAQILDRARQLTLYSPTPAIDADMPSYAPLLAHPRPKSMPLDAYLACAFTGLPALERALVFQLSDSVNVVCKEFDIDLYEPRKKTDPVHNPDVSDTDVFKTDRSRVVGSDLLIHLCHFPSNGAGEELDFAYNALVPIILIAHGDQKVSRMITGVPSLKVEIRYQEPEQLRSLLSARLVELRPFLEQRRMQMKEFQENLVGQRIRDLRLEAKLTCEELAGRVGMSAEGIRHLEESPDPISNPSLTHLRAIATALKTTVAELIVANFDEYVMSAVQSLMFEQKAARFGGMSKKDRNRLIRRVFYRVLDNLEIED